MKTLFKNYIHAIYIDPEIAWLTKILLWMLTPAAILLAIMFDDQADFNK
jgi:hypothetical protein